MARERFKKQQLGTFFGTFIYDRVVPEGHFLRKLHSIINWDVFTKQLVEYYSGGAMYGRPPYNPAVLLKMLLICYLYNLSERQGEQYVNDSLAAKWFLGLAADELAPHHSTLSKFRARLIRNGTSTAFETMLATIVGMAQEGGIQFGSVQVIDSVHTVADVNTAKDDQRQKEGKSPRDGDAAWGVKHTKRVRDDKGNSVKIPHYFYGYKMHASLNTVSELITSLTVTPGNAYPVQSAQDCVMGTNCQHCWSRT